MAGKKKREVIGTISGMDQFRYQSNKMHYEMQTIARQGSGAWGSKGYDRKRIKSELRRGANSDYGRTPSLNA